MQKNCLSCLVKTEFCKCDQFSQSCRDNNEVDLPLAKLIQGIRLREQVQYSLNEQLDYLRTIANKLGLYDAADYLKRIDNI